MSKYLLTNAEGRVISHVECSSQSAESNLIEVAEFPAGQTYVQGGNVIQCLDYNIDDIPTPCDLYIEGIKYRCDTGPVELNFVVPGRYLVSVIPDNIIYMEKDFVYDN